MWPEDDDGWDDEALDDPDTEVDEDDGVEDEIAAYAVSVWEEIDGDDELAEASREALVLIAQEALAKKEARLRREAASRRRLAQERAEQEARLARQRAERDRAEARDREERWQAECVARKARVAAVERAHTRREVPQRAEPQRGVAVRTGARPTWAGAGRSAPWGRGGERWSSVAPPASPVVIDEDLDEEETPPHLDTDDAAANLGTGWEGFDRPPLTGADLGAWRARHGLTQQAAADRLGARQGTVSKAESRRGDALGPALRDSLAEALAAE